MIHTLELADKYVKAAIITLLKDTVENMPLVNEPIGNLSRETEMVRQNKIEILELKDTISELRTKKITSCF